MNQEVGPVIKTVDAVVCPERRPNMRWMNTTATTSNFKFPNHDPNAPHVEISEEEINQLMRMMGL